MRITFYGVAQTTTGSMHLVEANGKRILTPKPIPSSRHTFH